MCCWIKGVLQGKSIRWSAVPVPCWSSLWLRLREGAGQRSRRDRWPIFHTYEEFSPPSPPPRSREGGHYGLKITTYQDLPPPTTLDHLTTPFHLTNCINWETRDYFFKLKVVSWAGVVFDNWSSVVSVFLENGLFLGRWWLFSISGVA